MTTPGQTIVVRHSPWRYVIIGAVLGVAGAGLGALAGRAPDWIADLPWAPYQEPIARLGEAIGPRASIALVVAGAIAGVVLAVLAHQDDLTVAITETAVRLRRGDVVTDVPIADVAGAFVDDAQFVLLGHDGRELARERTDLASADLRCAFDGHWHAHDPYDDDFERWVDGIPALGAHANAVLRARHDALERDDTADARELRAEAAKLGVVVRDRGGRQQWRRVGAVRP